MVNLKLSEQLVQLQVEKFPGLELSDGQVVTVPADGLLSLCRELKENPDYNFDYLTNLTAVEQAEHFVVVYNLVSLQNGYQLMLKVKLEDKENPSLPSLCHLWGGAAWQEREVYDLMGIEFTGYPGHPARILLDDGFKGYPLRKDFQWEGGREP